VGINEKTRKINVVKEWISGDILKTVILWGQKKLPILFVK
jgi:hypothetical protein